MVWIIIFENYYNFILTGFKFHWFNHLPCWVGQETPMTRSTQIGSWSQPLTVDLNLPLTTNPELDGFDPGRLQTGKGL